MAVWLCFDLLAEWQRERESNELDRQKCDIFLEGAVSKENYAMVGSISHIMSYGMLYMGCKGISYDRAIYIFLPLVCFCNRVYICQCGMLLWSCGMRFGHVVCFCDHVVFYFPNHRNIYFSHKINKTICKYLQSLPII